VAFGLRGMFRVLHGNTRLPLTGIGHGLLPYITPSPRRCCLSLAILIGPASHIYPAGLGPFILVYGASGVWSLLLGPAARAEVMEFLISCLSPAFQLSDCLALP
jgi:hypothetical protein